MFKVAPDFLDNKVRHGIQFDPTGDGFDPDVIQELVGGMTDELNMDTGLAGVNEELLTPPDAGAAASHVKDLGELTGGLEKANSFFSTKMSEIKKGMDDLTVGQTLGLQAGSAALQTIGSIMNINQSTSDQMEILRDQFDMAFGANEFQAERQEMAMEDQAIDDIMNQLNAMQQQKQQVEAQTLSNQQQMFFRNTNTGGRV